jgi:hypothetical protein
MHGCEYVCMHASNISTRLCSESMEHAYAMHVKCIRYARLSHRKNHITCTPPRTKICLNAKSKGLECILDVRSEPCLKTHKRVYLAETFSESQPQLDTKKCQVCAYVRKKLAWIFVMMHNNRMLSRSRHKTITCTQKPVNENHATSRPRTRTSTYM